MIEGSNEQKPQNDSEQPAQPQQENPQVEEAQNEKPQNQPPEHEETQSKKTFERKKTQKEQQQKVESEKTEEEEQSQKHHGPKDILFIRNQKISQKESLNQKRYFWNQPNLLNGKPNYPRIANPRIAQKENFFKNQYENSKEQTTSQLPPSRFIKSENYTKLDYHELDPLKEDAYAIMNGKYSSKREGIAYINPKANEPHELIDGRPPRKVMIDRMRKVYATINIETLLKQADIDFSTVSPLDSWLPLEFFEDKDLDIFTSNEWIEKAKDPQLGQLYIQGVGLYRDNDGVGTWKRVLINNYNKDTEKYEGIWDNDAEPKENCALSKIYQK